jgi:hypothetical protein
VEDENDNDPIFENDNYVVTISEFTAVGSVVLQVPAVDKDARQSSNTSLSKNGVVTYEIIGSGETFKINEDILCRIIRFVQLYNRHIFKFVKS